MNILIFAHEKNVKKQTLKSLWLWAETGLLFFFFFFPLSGWYWSICKVCDAFKHLDIKGTAPESYSLLWFQLSVVLSFKAFRRLQLPRPCKITPLNWQCHSARIRVIEVGVDLVTFLVQCPAQSSAISEVRPGAQVCVQLSLVNLQGQRIFEMSEQLGCLQNGKFSLFFLSLSPSCLLVSPCTTREDHGLVFSGTTL